MPVCYLEITHGPAFCRLCLVQCKQESRRDEGTLWGSLFQKNGQVIVPGSERNSEVIESGGGGRGEGERERERESKRGRMRGRGI